jgi:hypothetical protein
VTYLSVSLVCRGSNSGIGSARKPKVSQLDSEDVFPSESGVGQVKVVTFVSEGVFGEIDESEIVDEQGCMVLIYSVGVIPTTFLNTRWKCHFDRPIDLAIVSRFGRGIFGSGGLVINAMIFLTASSSGMELASSGLHRLHAR